jgi:hypothetical protein
MIDNLQYAVDGAWRVLLVSLAFGAGLPLIFALGLRSAAWGAGGEAEVSRARPHPLGWIAGAVLLLVVLAGVALGITIIAASGFGQSVSFEHGFPSIVAKEG